MEAIVQVLLEHLRGLRCRRFLLAGQGEEVVPGLVRVPPLQKSSAAVAAGAMPGHHHNLCHDQAFNIQDKPPHGGAPRCCHDRQVPPSKVQAKADYDRATWPKGGPCGLRGLLHAVQEHHGRWHTARGTLPR